MPLSPAILSMCVYNMMNVRQVLSKKSMLKKYICTGGYKWHLNRK